MKPEVLFEKRNKDMTNRNGRRKRNKKSFVEMRKMGRGERICLIMFYQIKFEIIIIILT